MRSRFTEDYGTRFPIVQGALGVLSMPALVAAVSEAGGMGTLGAVSTPLMSAQELRGLIRAVRALTRQPFGVSFDAIAVTDDHIHVCADARVAVVSFDAPEPAERHVRRLKSNGVRVWAKAFSVEDARAAVRLGADAVIAHGREAGGANRAKLGMLTLLPAVLEAISPVPVLASGGVVDGRGLAAVLALGADAAWIGTRFLASREANAHPDYKRRVVEAGEGDTVVSTVFSHAVHGRPMRTLRNRATESDRAGAVPAGETATEPVGRMEFGGRAVEIPAFSGLLPTPETEGDLDAMCLPAGESAALIRDVRPAGEIVRWMAAEAEHVLDGLTVGPDGSPRRILGSRSGTPV